MFIPQEDRKEQGFRVMGARGVNQATGLPPQLMKEGSNTTGVHQTPRRDAGRKFKPVTRRGVEGEVVREYPRDAENRVACVTAYTLVRKSA
ncbi:hypothetical protein [Corynebacterium vitaeruminis]|uniref:hypothetical protein n=1 Tax=Corynebacterium vitaeruminis TaxID=38305 RepID=UPI0012DE536A|nr:hypothetical protein [Corynebacterium vitaeruminis]